MVNCAPDNCVTNIFPFQPFSSLPPLVVVPAAPDDLRPPLWFWPRPHGRQGFAQDQVPIPGGRAGRRIHALTGNPSNWYQDMNDKI
jgi:hypothetical protein